jgi:putative spermidine/putrescine transport system permease protein
MGGNGMNEVEAACGASQADTASAAKSGASAYRVKKRRTKTSARVTIVLICLYLLLPLLLTFLYSLFRQWNGVLPQGVTPDYYARIFSDGSFLLSLARTVVISLAPVGLAVVIVLPAVYVTSVVMPEYEKVMQVLCTIPYALQGIILAISIVSLYAGAPFPFSNRVLMLVGTYCVVILPYIYRGIKNSLYAVNAKQLIESALLLGLTPFRAYIRVVVPNIIRGIKVSAMLAAALLFGDFAMVNIIGGSYFQTAQMYLYRQLFQSGQVSSAVIMILFIVTLVISGGVFYKKSGRKAG